MIFFAWHSLISKDMTLDKISKDLDKISKELAELRKSYNKSESDVGITMAVNESFRNQILTLERQCWSNDGKL